jgi:antirestriction protein ArdC
MTTEAKFDPYQAITNQVIELLEAGTAPWRKPWNAATGMPRSLTTDKVYRGINPFLLHMSALQHGFSSPYWATYKAIAERGGQVRKGEKGTMIVFWKQYLDKNEIDEKTGKPKQRFVLRTYKVFNTDQADGLAVPEFAPAAATDHDPIAECETVIAGYLAAGGPRVAHGHELAAYSQATDLLVMPDRSTFDTVEAYYSTYFHELTHSTGHKDRLARPDLLSFAHFGDKHYSKEELVAEMGAAMLAGLTGIAPVTLENSAAYLASWLKVLKSDSKLVVQAAAQAQKAADLVQGISFAAQQAAA